MTQNNVRNKASFPCTKMTATGNDFLLVDLKSESAPQSVGPLPDLPRKELAKVWCDRHFGLGADGLVFLEPSSEADFQWDFYNRDGSSAEMCGNAARCVATFALDKGWAKDKVSWKTLTGILHAERHDLGTNIEMPLIKSHQFDQKGSWLGQEFTFANIDSGVPHAVFAVEKIEPEKLGPLAREIRKDSRFAERGTNVTFFRALDAKKIESTSFERGFDQFTLSCGTGAVAAAFCHFKKTKNGEIEVRVPGGQLLVNFHKERPHLIGPAQTIAECQIYI